MAKKTIGGSKQAKRTISQKEVEGRCKYCGTDFTRLMFPGPAPVVCASCLERDWEEHRRLAARDRMRRLRKSRLIAKGE